MATVHYLYKHVVGATISGHSINTTTLHRSKLTKSENTASMFVKKCLYNMHPTYKLQWPLFHYICYGHLIKRKIPCPSHNQNHTSSSHWNYATPAPKLFNVPFKTEKYQCKGKRYNWNDNNLTNGWKIALWILINSIFFL